MKKCYFLYRSIAIRQVVLDIITDFPQDVSTFIPGYVDEFESHDHILTRISLYHTLLRLKERDEIIGRITPLKKISLKSFLHFTLAYSRLGI